MRIQSRFIRAALSVLLFSRLVSVSSLSQAVSPQDKNPAAPKQMVKRVIGGQEGIGADSPWTFDQKATDTRQQIRERLSMERGRGGSLLSRIRDWFSRPGDIGQNTGETQGNGKHNGDEGEEDGNNDGNDDDDSEEEEDTESPSTP